MEDLEFEEHPSEFLRYRRGANALSSVFMKKNLLVFFFIYAQQHKEERERERYAEGLLYCCIGKRSLAVNLNFVN